MEDDASDISRYDRAARVIQVRVDGFVTFLRIYIHIKREREGERFYFSLDWYSFIRRKCFVFLGSYSFRGNIFVLKKKLNLKKKTKKKQR